MPGRQIEVLYSITVDGRRYGDYRKSVVYSEEQLGSAFVDRLLRDEELRHAVRPFAQPSADLGTVEEAPDAGVGAYPSPSVVEAGGGDPTTSAGSSKVAVPGGVKRKRAAAADTPTE